MEQLVYPELETKDRLNVLIVGDGGRENALAWKLRQAERLGELTMVSASHSNQELVLCAQEHTADLVIVGPDNSLANGLVDDLTKHQIAAFGPTKQAARIESSKPYAKRLMSQSGVPTANFEVFTNPKVAHEYVEHAIFPLYLKAGGLAYGKGAQEADAAAKAHKIIDDYMVKMIHGDAGKEVVIEEFLTGQEISLHSLVDANCYQLFPSSQDHKKRFAGDRGPMTGGLGTIAPVPWFPMNQVRNAAREVIDPILAAMDEAASDFEGLLYPGLMVTPEGLRVIEYNARFGDPETQVYMRLLETDLLELFVACKTNKLDEIELKFSNKHAICIVAATNEYPNNLSVGQPVYGLDNIRKMSDVEVFLAGSKEVDGAVYTNGGRILGVTAVGGTLAEAQDKGYAAMEQLYFEGIDYRADIGSRPHFN